ncbi:hypothetical protein FPRO05_13703 [Fusarium proliferatum]|uniref:lytic cellulose monooxygenase (C4-dehydrogenating) n=1 Tax=Gibberella intermedia TaxID=948311 RepID=A0A365MXP5_GIBIN|nr:hypothetical protein FPRO05_13703 [Fusarium proliferatum]
MHFCFFLAAFVGNAAAHGVVSSFKTDGVEHQGYLMNYYYDAKNGKSLPPLAAWSAENLDNGFVSPDNYTHPDIICQKNGKPANLTVQVAAGGTVDFQWTKWAHFGPMMTYVAPCGGDCSTVDKATLKIGGAQNYPQCLNIEITGSGTAKPEGVLGTKLYTPTDPGIYFNPYTTLKNYTIPGPPLFKNDNGSLGNRVITSSSARGQTTATSIATTLVTSGLPTQTTVDALTNAFPTATTIPNETSAKSTATGCRAVRNGKHQRTRRSQF